ncbi:MAG: alpha/beta hydrolase [Saprospiraceae bacterium]|nr:alpha/beta hydrolase [Saprospiraceae bacterium]
MQINKIILFASFLLGTAFALNAQTESGFAPSGEVQVHYKTSGTGRPVLIINGGPGMNSNGFEALAQKLSGQYRAILFDQRGTGQTRVPAINAEHITMAAMAADMEALRRHLGIESWVIIGHSFGGLLASYYTTLHPERVEALVYSSSGGLDLSFRQYIGESVNSKLSKKELADFQMWSQKIQQGDTSSHARLERAKALAPAYVYDKKFVPQLAIRLTQIVPVVNELVFNDLQKIGYDCKVALRSFVKPVLIIQGREDIIREETARVAQGVLPQAKVVLMDKCGHYGWLDRPDIYFGELSGFLEVVPLPLSLKDSTLFDFWVGDWELSWTNANGTPGKGTNLIEKMLDGKVIRENFAADSGFKGTSISVFHAGTQSWRQAWADNQGGYFDFEAKLEGVNRVFQTKFRESNGKKVGARMVFRNVRPNGFTWDWEGSTDGGTSWNLQWRVEYKRR